MALAAGVRLGPYEVLELIGAGGMGEVYKAKDTRLDRTVAIKVLPADISNDSGRRARFEREAKTIAGLSHPHICTLHDVGERGSSLFLVMEYLTGRTLADRLREGALPIDQALETGAQVAEALAAAHRAGIIHRDLKPANVMLTKSGVKLLDFGLAKLGAHAGQPAFVTAETHTHPLTSEGTIVGTLHYMAPEQIEGKEADARTDIWALGLVLYEMLTGTRAFDAESSASLLAAILARQPAPIGSINRLSPPSVDRLVTRCLSKTPDDRWESAHDIADELRWIAHAPTGGDAAGPLRRWRQVGPAIAGVLLGAVIATAVTWNRSSPAPSSLVFRSVVRLTPANSLNVTGPQRTADGRPFSTAIAIAPDGRTIVFSAVRDGRRELYVRPLDRLDATVLPGTEGADNPFFSPDGKWIGFWTNGELRKSPLGGGPAVTICALLMRPIGQTWDERDRIVFGRTTGGLWEVSALGGAPRLLTAPDKVAGEVSHRLPHALPNGDVLFTVMQTRFPKWTDARLAVFSRSTRSHRVVINGGADGQYVNSGHVVYIRSGDLMAVPFDITRVEPTGAPVALIADVMQSAYGISSPADTGAGQFSVSATGTLVYVGGGVVPDEDHSLYWVDRRGHAEKLPLPPRPFFQPRISPDGQNVALYAAQSAQEIWIYNLSRRTLTRLRADGRNGTPVWSPDGRRILYRSSVGGSDNLFYGSVGGSSAAERITAGSEHEVPAAWSPDGRVLAFYRINAEGVRLWTVAAEGKRTPREFARDAGGADFSPDGRWLAYDSPETQSRQVYVEAFPSGGNRQQLSSDGGYSPVWSHDGRELFFLQPSHDPSLRFVTMMSIPVTPGPTPRFGPPRALFEGPYELNVPARAYDVARDAQHFALVQVNQSPAPPVTELVVVQNWFEELKSKAPVK